MNNQAATNVSKPHFILVPLMAQGHMLPMVDMARLLAARGAIVSFITTPVNAARIRPLIDTVTASRLPISFIELPFPATSAGLPDGCENFDLIPPGHSFKQFYTATTLLAKPLELYIRRHLNRGPTCVVHDHCHPWTLRVTRALGIPRLTFTGTSCSYLLHNHSMDAPPFFSAPGWEDARDEAIEAEATAVGTLINTFYELEAPFIDAFRSATKKKVWAIGPLSLHNNHDCTATRGGEAAVGEEVVSSWLRSMQPRSVVYVSFGTMARTRSWEIREIGLGLEAAGRPFIWVVKESSPEVEKWWSVFEERNKGRGLLIKGWAPQVMILSHRAVGGFITHCGWNSTLEGVAAGLPMVTWPRSTDQFLNEKLVVEVMRTGFAVGGDGRGVVVTRGEVEEAVVRLMDGGDEGEERRERGRELGEKARVAMEEGGSSYKDLTDLIKYFS